MKKVIAATGIATLMASSSVLADTFEYNIYGKANLGIMSQDTETSGVSATTTDLESFASRVGIKGKAKISDNLDAIFQWENQIDLADGDATGNGDTIKARNQIVGLKGNFGKVIGGLHDTPMKSAEGKIDQFSDLVDIARVQDPYMDTQEREKSFLGYYSPKKNNVQFQIATMKGKGDDLGDAFSTALVYGDKKLKKTKSYAALAYDSGVDETKDSNAIRLAGATKIGKAAIGAIIETADTGRTGAESQTRYVLSGKVKLNKKNTLKLQYAASDDAHNGSKQVYGSTDTTIGISHKLAKNTSIYGLVSKGTEVGGKKDVDQTTAIVGLVHKFKF